MSTLPIEHNHDDEYTDESSVDKEINSPDDNELGNGAYYRQLQEEHEKDIAKDIHAIPIDPTLPPSRRANLLKRRLKAIYIKHPHIKPKRASSLDKLLNSFNEQELDDLLFNVQLELGAVHPFASGSAVTTAVGIALEYALGLDGISRHLLADQELIAVVDSHAPTLLSDDSPFRILQLLAENVINYMNKMKNTISSAVPTTYPTPYPMTPQTVNPIPVAQNTVIQPNVTP